MIGKITASAFVIATLLLTSCATTGKMTDDSTMSTETETMSESMDSPRLIESEDNYHVYRYEGRIWVIGSDEINTFFKENHHIPITRTLLGAGPNFETVIFEADSKDDSVAERLKAKYESTPFLLEKDADGYHLWKYQDRLYVTGKPETAKKFKEHPHLPYTKTILGLGPFGETVIFEVDTKNPELADSLVAKYENTPFLIRSEGDDFYVWIYKGRIYVIGSEEMNNKFEERHHLPYTKTVLGAGPNGETVIFEVNTKDEGYAERLVTQYNQG